MTPPQKLEKIGRYQVLERVGKGGMGVLYRGFDPVLDREVAIKLMLADFSEDTEQMRPRFYREARAAAKLNHRNIVTIFEFAEESNVPYIVMEFLRGIPLGARMKSEPPLTLDDKLNVVAQLCDGLSYAHEQGVVHRDVKPDNVFLLEDGSIKLLDFGIAKLTSSTLTRQGDVLGSASYMSPEQVGGSDSVDGRADVFSAGVLLYELLSGRKPFEGDSPTAVIIKILREPPTPIESVTASIPAPLIAVVMRALAKDPAERFQTADAMGRELQMLRKTLHPVSVPGQMDETRFASTQVMKALHEDFERSRGAGQTATGQISTSQTATSRTGTSRTGIDLTRGVLVEPNRPGGTAVMTAPATEVRETERKSSWLIPALVGGAVVAVLAVGAMRLFSPPAPAVTEANVPANPTQAVAPAASGAAAAPGTVPNTEPASVQSAAPVGNVVPPTDVPVAPPSATAPPAPAAATASIPAPPPSAPALPPVAPAAATAAAARTADAASPKSAPEEPAEAVSAAPVAVTGTMFIDFVNTFPDGSAEVEIDGRRRWSEKLGLSQQVAGLAKLKLQRVSEQLGQELKLAPGDHRVTVTVLNADGEVRDIATTAVHVVASRAVTLKIRVSRFKNQLQVESVAGEPDGK